MWAIWLFMSETPFDFDKMADGYDAWYATPDGRRHDAAQKQLICRLLPDAGIGAQMLDVGCGTGHWSVFFAKLGFHVTGLDISPKMIAAARGRHAPNCRFSVGDVMRLPYKDERFHVACAITVMEFVPDMQCACEEIFRCLKPGGCMIIGTLNRLAAVNRQRVAAGAEPFASARMFTLDELQRFLAQFGNVTIGISMENCGVGRKRKSPVGKRDNPPVGHADGALIAARVVKP